MNSTNLRSAVVIVILIAAARSRLAIGQSPTAIAKHPGVSATVVEVATIPYGNADAVIVRRPQILPHDVIMLRPSAANSAYLAEALHDLAVIRARTSDVPDKATVVRVNAPHQAQKNEASAALVSRC